MKSVLITGGAGFIGSTLTKALLSQGYSVFVLDNLSTGDESRLAGLDIRFEVGSICTPVTVQKIVREVDTVFHLAALPSVKLSVDRPLATVESTDYGTAVVLDAMRRTNAKTMVLASSCAIYGDNPPPCREDMYPNVLSPYAAAKLASEAYLRAACITHGLRGMALRLFNVYGPGQDPDGEYAAVVPKFLEKAAEGAEATIFGDGGQTRDFVFVDDVVEAFIAASLRESKGDVVNIGSGHATSLLDLVQTIASATGRPLNVKHQDARLGDIRHSFADISKRQTSLPDLHFRNLHEGLQTTWAGMQ